MQTEQKNKGMNNFGKMGWAVIIYTLMIYLFTCVTNDTLNVSTGFFGGFLQVDPNSLLPFAALGGLAGVVLSLIAGLVIVPAVSLFTKAPDKARLEEIFACYEKTVVVTVTDSIGDDR